MPTPDNDPFEEVYNAAQWKASRDKTGQKGSLTEKVSLTDAFTRFQKHKDVAGAELLLKQMDVYLQVLNNKHRKEPYYAKLLKLVNQQQEIIQAGIKETYNRPNPIKEVKETHEIIKSLMTSLNELQEILENVKEKKVAQEHLLRAEVYKNEVEHAWKKLNELIKGQREPLILGARDKIEKKMTFVLAMYGRLEIENKQGDVSKSSKPQDETRARAKAI
jgi:hypothetical protein